MRGFLTALILCLVCVAAPQLATAQTTASLSGEWHGVYVYANPSSSGQVETEFTLQLRETAGQLTGATIERNNFGSSDALFLLASIRGQHTGASVTFTKTYDGTGGQTHSVQYTGTITPNGRRIVGSWTGVGTAAGITGQFEMVR